MKKIYKISVLVFSLLLFGCTSAKFDGNQSKNQSEDVSYIATNVQDVQGQKVFLTDGTVLELERIPFIDSGTRVLVVIKKDLPGGFLYSGNRKYRLVPSSYRAFDKGYESFYHDGVLTKVRGVNIKKGVLMLANNERYKIERSDIPLLKLFAGGDEIIIDESGNHIINIRLGSEIQCSKIINKQGKRLHGKERRKRNL
jgi:hypothetical protein